MLVALRVIIGWHFLTAGLEKLDPSFTSAGFLRGANGPLAEFYHSMAPLPHDWDKLIDEPLPNAAAFASDRRYVDKKWVVSEKPTSSDKTGFIPYPTKAYGPWAARVADDWHATLKQFKSLPGSDDEQKEAAEQVFQESYIRFANYMEGVRGEISDYQHELTRYEEMVESDEATDDTPVPFMKDRITSKKAEIQATPRPWVAAAASQETIFRDGLVDLVSDEQRESATLSKRLDSVMNPGTQLDKIDTTVMLVTLIVGVCLIIGLFTRLAAVVGAGFLLSVMSTQPPWAEGVLNTVKLLTAYQGIEFIGLLLLAGAGAGAWAGLDGLLWRGNDDQ